MLPAGYCYSTRASKGSDVFAGPGLTAPKCSLLAPSRPLSGSATS